MSEFKKGDTILVSPNGAFYVERVFVAEFKGCFHCEMDGGVELTPWRFAKPLPKKEYRPFTQKTFPRTPTLIRAKEPSNDEEYFVTGIFSDGVLRPQSFIKYAHLLKHYEMLDGDTWVPAGVKL